VDTRGIIGRMPKNYILLRKKAINLRKQGLSYGEISKNLSVAKSTLSLWLKSIPLSSKDKKRLYIKQILILSRGPKSQRERRAKEIETIVEKAVKEIIFPLSPETFRLMGASLYWAEGSKDKLLILTNSDPSLILFFVRWVESMFGIPPQKQKARLNIYPQQNEMKIKKFWSELTNIPIQNFGKTYIKPKGKAYKKNNLYYGTIRIEIPKSVNLRYTVFGWIKGSLKNVKSNVELTQKKWQSLTKTTRPVNI
jgi:hypothetical protein